MWNVPICSIKQMVLSLNTIIYIYISVMFHRIHRLTGLFEGGKKSPHRESDK